MIGWALATALLSLSFAAIYYWAPDFQIAAGTGSRREARLASWDGFLLPSAFVSTFITSITIQ